MGCGLGKGLTVGSSVGEGEGATLGSGDGAVVGEELGMSIGVGICVGVGTAPAADDNDGVGSVVASGAAEGAKVKDSSYPGTEADADADSDSPCLWSTASVYRTASVIQAVMRKNARAIARR